ncbi:hypothetical protein WAF17_18515 [Bernardetia sp. ABR2-2B]|uniref:hypothetical protein n=1 Tax=Bernardetia sp. ABR2-2B TaxID=3127472 RepID=UPI0030CF08AD
MKQKILLLFSIFSILFFASFASESKSEILPKKETSNTKIISQRNNLVPPKKQKLNFKERLALKLVKKKIKKAQKKQAKNKRSILEDGIGLAIAALLSVLLILGSLIGGIIALAMGETLLGILLVVGGLIFIPLILIVILLAIIANN